jgi:hypothetical protein
MRFERLDALQVGSSQALIRMAAEVRATRKDDAAAPGEASVHQRGTASDGPSFSKVFIDINGNRPLPAVAGVLQMVLQELRPDFVCCKSRELHAALTAQCKKGPRCNIDL